MYRPTNSTGPHGPSVGELRDERGDPVAHDSEGAESATRAASGVVRAAAAAPAALGKHVRQPLERFGRLLQSGGDLIRVGPVGGIQPLGQRVQRLLSRGIRRPLRDPLANDRMPVREKRDLLVGRRAFDRRGNRDARRCGAGRCGGWRRGRDGAGAGGDASGVSPLRAAAAAAGLGRRLDDLLALANQSASRTAMSGYCASICRSTSGSSGSRPTRTPPGVRNTYRILRSLTLPVAIQVHQIRGLVPALVANDPQERHRAYLRFRALEADARLARRPSCHRGATPPTLLRSRGAGSRLGTRGGTGGRLRDRTCGPRTRHGAHATARRSSRRWLAARPPLASRRLGHGASLRRQPAAAPAAPA